MPGVEQAERERAEARTDLEHRVPGREFGGADDAPDGVGVVQEVLAEGLGRPHAERRGQLTDLGRAEQGAQNSARRIRSLTALYGGYTNDGSGLAGLRSTALRWLNVSKPQRP